MIVFPHREMKALPPLAPDVIEQLTRKSSEHPIQVTLIIPARKSSDSLEITVSEAHQFLTRRYPSSFEIIIVPNPAPGDTQDRSAEIAHRIASRLPEILVCPHLDPPGKGAAIQTGFRYSRGRWIFFTDADLPYDLEFFDRAAASLKEGYDLVTGNRRLPESHFDIPVELLRLAYRRHRLGLGYNRLVRILLPITTTDTQAGIKALSRKLALRTFGQLMCPGFLFDLELFLTCKGQGYRQQELPVTLYLNSEKSTVRILRECLMVANWLTKIAWKNWRGGYGVQNKSTNRAKLFSRYNNATWSTLFFLTVRWKLTPYSQMAAHLPLQGKILDLGCGHGLFALAVALQSPLRQILGIDHDAARISLAKHATRDLAHVEIKVGSLAGVEAQSTNYSAVAMIDVMHYFNPSTQEKLVQQAFQLLEKGGILLVREVDPNAGMVSTWNRLYEKIATGIGFTRAEKSELYFRSRPDWEELLKKNGFKVSSERCSSFLFADILYVCERP